MLAKLDKLTLEIFGESHTESIGMKLFGVPVGSALTLDRMKDLLSRRRARGAWATPRREEDAPVLLGIRRDGEYVVTEPVIQGIIANRDVRKADYDEVVPRPSHADFAAYMRDGKISSGGGRFSGRMTAPLCVAGGIALELLEKEGVRVCAYVSDIGKLHLGGYGDSEEISLWGISEERERELRQMPIPMLDSSKREEAEALLLDARGAGDSVGGVVECVVTGARAGAFGDAMFEGLESKLSYMLFGVPAVKGVEFGSGFGFGAGRGSEMNDAFVLKDGQVRCASNHSGGINGGISNGMPLLLRAAMRPTPSIALAQRSVRLDAQEECELKIKGRHDACIVPRAVPCVEAAVGIALYDELLKRQCDKG